MTDRFSLRLASGERAGQIVPLAAPRVTIGRRPENTISIQDASISGQHAELLVEGGEVRLRDLGSTNGTKVGGIRISEQRLAHGDRITLGSFDVVFQDGELAGASSAAAPTPAAGEGQLESISADNLARSGKGSKAGLLVGLVLVVAAGGAGAFFFMGGESGGGRKFEAPPVVTGNMIQGGDFEGEELSATWTVEELGAADFVQRGDARATGRDGVRSALEGGERARMVSAPLGVSAGKVLQLAASLRARGGGVGRVGVELLTSGEDGALTGTVAWSDSVFEATQHQRIELDVPVPSGVRQARLVIEASADDGEGGSVDVDDVSLVAQGGGATPDAKVGEFTLWLLGSPTRTAALYKISKPLVGDLRGAGGSASRPPTLTQAAGGKGYELRASGAEGLTLRVEAEALRQGLASLGEGGYLEHSPAFERQGATSLLLAEGKDLVALNFSKPVTLTGRAEGSGVRVEASGEGATVAVLQLDFSADRAEAGNLAHAARKSEREGRLGDCLAEWGRVLGDYPFEASLVTEAREARSRLTQTGLEELEVVTTSFERAKFFRLVDLFRLCRTNAEQLAEKFGGSEVEEKARLLIAEIEVSLADLEADLSEDEIMRLRAIARALEASDSPRLAGAVRGYLKTEFGAEN
jgi:hypothetical protein